MLENIGFFGAIILFYALPILVAIVLMNILRSVIQDNWNKEFFCGLIFLQATREVFRSLRGRRNRGR